MKYKKRRHMLTAEEVKELLLDLENERVERTISTDNTEKFSQAICAFANDVCSTGLPGYLFIGAYDNGTLSRLKATDRLLKNLSSLRSEGNILPAPSMSVYTVSFPEGDVAVIEVQPSKLTPVRYKGRIWIRVGPRKAIANEDDERILMEKRVANFLPFETQPCYGSTIDDLDLDAFKIKYLPKAIDPELLKNDNRDVKSQLASLRLYDKSEDCPTNFGMLLLGKAPTLFIGGAYVQYVKFEGTHRATKVLKEVAFKGNLLKTLEDIDVFVHYTIENQRPVYVTMMREDMKINYPYRAMREIVMNSIMHRSFEGTNSPIRFYEYSDRIEIDNPGNLYGRANIENFPNETDYRNPLIASAMKILGYVNQFGMGLKTARETLAHYDCKQAEYILDDYTTFKVVVYSSDYDSKGTDVTGDVIDNVIGNVIGGVTGKKLKVNERRHAILQYMFDNKYVSASQLAEALGVTPRTIFRDIDALRKDHKLDREGDENTGYWVVLQR